MSEKLVLIDGHSILNRAFYGMPDLTNAAGLHTGAVYGFLNILFRILDEEKADYLTVAFDVHAPTFRHEAFEAYKGTRHAMPEELREQVPLIKKVLAAMNIKTVEQAGLEADDILGTLARKSEALGMEVTLVSGDRDLLQIASDHILIRIPKTKKGETIVENYHASDVKEALGVTPSEFIEVKALQGDTSDNIPGVPKVGPKTATELIQKYHSVDGVYAHLDEITKKSLHENLAANEELARLSLFLATIKTDADVELDKEKAAITDFYTKEAFEIFTELGFKNLLKRFDTSTARSVREKGAPLQIEKAGGASEAEEVFRKALAAEEIAVFPVFDSSLLAVALCIGDTAYWIPAESGQLTLDQLLGGASQRPDAAFISDGLARIRKEAKKGGHIIDVFDIKKQYPVWQADRSEFEDGIRLDGIFDLLLGAYLINPLKNDYEPEDVASEYLQTAIVGKKQLLGKQSFAEKLAENEEEVMRYACMSAHALLKAAPLIREKLRGMDMWDLYEKTELPLSYILYDMQRLGIRILPDKLKEYGDRLVGRIDELEKEIHEEAGVVFNIASPKQLGEILFEKMGLPGGKKTKTGYSTAADVLEKLSPDYPIVEKILEYRGLTKLKATYADGLSVFIGSDSRIHTTFNQTITATGRISSTDPNLQNIPMRTELGRAIRKVFVPKDGYIFTDADYSQIELRILASMSGDEALIEAFNENKDIHRMTASRVFHTPFEEVTDLQRRNAKAVNFGIVYGISSFGLSQDLSISRKEAAKYIEDYFAMFPGIKGFLDGRVEFARKNGYSVTLFGRRRPIPELKSSNFMQRQFGERVAMNAPIQGTGADIMKIAMIRVWEELRRRRMKSELILQIHDELLIETAPGEEEAVIEVLKSGMTGAADLAVRLEADAHTGSDWYEAK